MPFLPGEYGYEENGSTLIGDAGSEQGWIPSEDFSTYIPPIQAPAQDISPATSSTGGGGASSSTGRAPSGNGLSIYGVPEHVLTALQGQSDIKRTQITDATANRQIDESARQYNQTATRLKMEFEKTLELELQKLGLDKDQLEEGKRQFNIKSSGYMDYDPNKGMPTPNLAPPADFARQMGPVPPLSTTPSPFQKPPGNSPLDQGLSGDVGWAGSGALAPPAPPSFDIPAAGGFQQALGAGLPVGM